ncbi:MAG: hypothetical protein U0744_12195 [Gemmataceae bacterium]
MLDLTPRVLNDDNVAGLVVEESHLSRGAIGICGALLACTFLIPAVVSGLLLRAVVAIVLGVIVVGLPFLIALAFSKYRRLEVREGVELLSVTVYVLRSSRSIRVAWDRIDRVICERRRDRSQRPGRMVVTLRTLDGAEHRLLWGWYSERVKAILRRHFADKFEFAENFSSW